MASRRTSYGLSEPSVSMRNSWVSLISGASCGSFTDRVSMASRRSNGGRRNSLVTRLHSGNGSISVAAYRTHGNPRRAMQGPLRHSVCGTNLRLQYLHELFFAKLGLIG